MTPSQNVNLTVSDPISADIQAICKAVEATMTFLASPEGQKTVATWRDSSVAFNAAVQKAATWLENLFAGKLG